MSAFRWLANFRLSLMHGFEIPLLSLFLALLSLFCLQKFPVCAFRQLGRKAQRIGSFRDRTDTAGRQLRDFPVFFPVRGNHPLSDATSLGLVGARTGFATTGADLLGRL